MKKILLYIVVAVVLGLSLTLIPATILAKIRVDNHEPWEGWFSLHFRQFREAYDTIENEQPSAEFAVLGVSLGIALLAYLLFRRKMPPQNYSWIRPY